MYMCGNLGDPTIAQDTLEIFEYFGQIPNMWLSMNTNGGANLLNGGKNLQKYLILKEQ